MYLFHIIVILNPDFNCSFYLLSFSADKVTTGSHNLQSVILNFASVGDSIAAIGGLVVHYVHFLKLCLLVHILCTKIKLMLFRS